MRESRAKERWWGAGRGKGVLLVLGQGKGLGGRDQVREVGDKGGWKGGKSRRR